MLSYFNCIPIFTRFSYIGQPGGYAFIANEPSLRYITRNPPCVTRTLGRPFLKSGFGLAMQKGFPHLKKFNLEILKLREDGFIDELDQKWITGKCPDPLLGKGMYHIHCSSYTLKKFKQIIALHLTTWLHRMLWL